MATLETALQLMQDLRGSCYAGAAQVLQHLGFVSWKPGIRVLFTQELKELQAFAESKGFSGTLMPWDTTFYAGYPDV